MIKRFLYKQLYYNKFIKITFFYIVVILISFIIIPIKSHAQDIDWYGSQLYKKNPYHPYSDKYNHEWYEKTFDDKTWSPISLPDKDWECDDCDRFYRGYFNITSTNLNINDFYINIKSDDGIWIYVNGQYLGHWGADLHKPGCANFNYWGSEKVDPIYISDKLVEGQNVIAVHVSEHQGGEYFDLSFYIRPKR